MSLYDYWMEKSAEGDEGILSKLMEGLKRSSLGEGARVIGDVGSSAFSGGGEGLKKALFRLMARPGAGAGLSDDAHEDLLKGMEDRSYANAFKNSWFMQGLDPVKKDFGDLMDDPNLLWYFQGAGRKMKDSLGSFNIKQDGFPFRFGPKDSDLRENIADYLPKPKKEVDNSKFGPRLDQIFGPRIDV